MILTRLLARAVHFSLSSIISASVVVAVAAFGMFQFAVPQWRKESPLKEMQNGRKRNVMFVTAHPDDECMFFAPTIQNLLQHNVYLLCLSKGDFYKIGDLRTKELIKSAKLLGLKKENIFLHNDVDLQDDPDVVWDEYKVAIVVEQYYEIYKIDVLITFDKKGISGHSNHIGVHNGVRTYVSANAAVQGFELVTVNILRKYLSILDVVVTYFSGEPHVFLSDIAQAMAAHNAMLEHKSQMTWYRMLYIIFSRYMHVNHLHPIN